MTRLSVNLNKVALVRNARAGTHPGPNARPRLLGAAATAVEAGAHGLTLHPRPDRRHALPEDVEALAAWLARERPGVELNVEGNPFHGPAPGYPGFLALVEAVRPAQATLVPDGHGQLTSDHGWTLDPDELGRLAPVVARLRACGCRVSLFVAADAERVARAREAGADRVELYTGPWAEAFAAGGEADALWRYAAAAERAGAAGLGVNAGHDLDLDNLGPFLRGVPGVAEVSIGQALVADALESGLGAAVRAYLDVIRSSGPGASS